MSRIVLLPSMLLVAAVLPIMAIDTAGAAPAPDQGQRAWLQCRACHSLKAGEPDKTGPNLNGLFGAKAASLRPGYAYSPALKASGIVWSEATLDAWLKNPAATVRGNRMAYSGMADPAQRKALIAWLKAQTR